MATVKKENKAAVFDRLNVRPVINASGIYTDLGGSVLSSTVWSDLAALNEHYVDLVDLLDQTGRIISALVHSEAARVTPGVSAGLALASAAAMAGQRGEYWEQLPDTCGMRNEIILQRVQAERYKYINPVRLSGAKIVLAGTGAATTLKDISNTIHERTAALLIPAHLDSLENVVRLDELGEFCKDRDIRLLVDAAYQVFPAEHMRTYAQLGADLTMFSSKYYFGPNAGGFLSGTREMVNAVAGLDFTKFESGPFRPFGRPFKMGRYEIAAVCLALQEWFATDHDQRLRECARKAARIAELLSACKGLSTRLCGFTLDESIIDAPVNAVLIGCTGSSPDAKEIVRMLQQSNPAIYTVPVDAGFLVVTETLQAGEEVLLAERLLKIMREYVRP